MVCKFAHANLLKRHEVSNLFWLAGFKNDYLAISQNFHELAKVKILWNQYSWAFYHIAF